MASALSHQSLANVFLPIPPPRLKIHSIVTNAPTCFARVKIKNSSISDNWQSCYTHSHFASLNARELSAFLTSALNMSYVRTRWTLASGAAALGWPRHKDGRRTHAQSSLLQPAARRQARLWCSKKALQSSAEETACTGGNQTSVISEGGLRPRQLALVSEKNQLWFRTREAYSRKEKKPWRQKERAASLPPSYQTFVCPKMRSEARMKNRSLQPPTSMRRIDRQPSHQSSSARNEPSCWYSNQNGSQKRRTTGDRPVPDRCPGSPCHRVFVSPRDWEGGDWSVPDFCWPLTTTLPSGCTLRSACGPPPLSPRGGGARRWVVVVVEVVLVVVVVVGLVLTMCSVKSIVYTV